MLYPPLPARAGVWALALLPLSTTAAGPHPCCPMADSLGTAVVTAQRQATALTAATPVQRLDSVALRRQGITDIGDALRRFAGVTVRDYGGAGGMKSVAVRGLGAAHTAVTLDGLPVSSIGGGQCDLGRFSTDQLAGIALEVADAAPLLTPVRTLAAATVALTTALPDSVRHLAATLRGGAFTTISPALTASTPVGHRTAIGGAARFYFGENDYPFTIANGVASTRERRQNSRMQTWQGEVNAVGTTDNSRWTAKGYYYNNHRRLPGAVVLYTQAGHEQLAEEQALAQGRWHSHRGRWQLMAAGKYDYQRNDYSNRSAEYPGGLYAEHYRLHEGYASAGAAVTLGPLAVAYAADAQGLYLATNQGASPHRRALQQSLSLRYAAGALTLTARMAAHLSADRHDGSTTRARRLTPQLSGSWTVISTTSCRLMLRAHYQELFRLPTFAEAYYYHLGSTNLRPELTRQIGGGMTLRLQGRGAWQPAMALTADAYRNRVSQRIMSIPYNLFIWRTVNMGQVSTTGADITINATATPARRHRLTLTGSYTLQDARDRSEAGTTGYNCQLAYTPRHSGSASINWENPLCGLSLHTTMASERWATNEHLPTTRLAGYAEMGAGIYRTLTVGRTTITLRADGLNLLDKHYAIVRRYPMPGRAWQASLSVAW